MFDLVAEKPKRQSQKHTTHNTDVGRRKKPFCETIVVWCQYIRCAKHNEQASVTMPTTDTVRKGEVRSWQASVSGELQHFDGFKKMCGFNFVWFYCLFIREPIVKDTSPY